MVVVFLCACKSASVTPVIEGITFNAHVFYFNKEYTCSVDVAKGGDMVLTITEPELLSGAKVVLAGKEAYAEFRDIKYPVDPNRAEGVPYFLLGVLRDAKTKKGEQKGDAYILSGQWQDTQYQMFLAGSGLPLKLTAENIEIEIYDAKISN